MLLTRVNSALLLLALPLTLGGCRNPTQILLDVRTDVQCGSGAAWKGVAIYVGHPGDDVESKAPTLITQACDGTSGEVGSLVIVPSGSHDDIVGIRVVAGLTRNPEDCAAAGYSGCIVERRVLRFVGAQSISLAVVLPKVCTGVPCNQGETCRDGACIDNFSAASTELIDAGPPTSGPVRCGDNGASCPTSGDICCLSVDADAGTTHGDCRQPHDCPSTSAVLACDKSSDCAGQTDDAGQPYVCCAIGRRCDGGGYALSHCVPLADCSSDGTELMCQDRGACPVSGNLCKPGQVPGYFACRLTRC